MTDTLGALLRQKREREGLSLRDAGALSGIAFSTLGRIENGGNLTEKIAQKARAWLQGEAPILPTPPMTLRDYFAGQAIGAVIGAVVRQFPSDAAHSYPEDVSSMEQFFASKAYAVADAMLSERSKSHD